MLRRVEPLFVLSGPDIRTAFGAKKQGRLGSDAYTSMKVECAFTSTSFMPVAG
jgi:hypothetical protein